MVFKKGNIPIKPFEKGHIPWMKGKHHSKETRRKMSETRKRLIEEGKITSWNKNQIMVNCNYCGKKLYRKQYRIKTFKYQFCSRECHYKWRKGKSNPKLSETLKRKIEEGKLNVWNKGITGYSTSWKGRHHARETREKFSLWQIGKKNNNWKGGISFEPYSPEFNNILRKQIMERDNYTCQECGKTKKEIKRNPMVHHIDYDKKNNNHSNLICLCNICHGKTIKNRYCWMKYFQYKLSCYVTCQYCHV